LAPCWNTGFSRGISGQKPKTRRGFPLRIFELASFSNDPTSHFPLLGAFSHRITYRIDVESFSRMTTSLSVSRYFVRRSVLSLLAAHYPTGFPSERSSDDLLASSRYLFRVASPPRKWRI